MVDTWLWDQEVPGSSHSCARSMLSPWERFFTRISSPHSCVKHEYPTIGSMLECRVICNDSSSVMLPRKLRKAQWLEWPVGDTTLSA